MDPLVIPVVAILMPLVLVPTLVVLKQRHGRREWEHLERMKAMELGVPTGHNSGVAKSIASIGAGVPAVSVFTAFLTCVEGPSSVEGVPLAAIVWSCAALISGGAFLTSLLLAVMIGRPRRPAGSADEFQRFKPVYEPDAFDVVSSRG